MRIKSKVYSHHRRFILKRASLAVMCNDELYTCLWSGALFFFQVGVMQGVGPVRLYSEEARTEPPDPAPDDPAVKHRDASISVGDATCQQKADEKMKEIQTERLSASLRFIRRNMGGRTPMRRVLL